MDTKPVLLITGANAGLGYETVRSLCQSSQAYTILLGGRSFDKATAAAKKAQEEFPQTSSVIKTIQVDIEDDESISRSYEHVSKEDCRLDVLVNNAGKFCDLRIFYSWTLLRLMFIGGQFEKEHAAGQLTARNVE